MDHANFIYIDKETELFFIQMNIVHYLTTINEYNQSLFSQILLHIVNRKSRINY